MLNYLSSVWYSLSFWETNSNSSHNLSVVGNWSLSAFAFKLTLTPFCFTTKDSANFLSLWEVIESNEKLLFYHSIIFAFLDFNTSIVYCYFSVTTVHKEVVIDTCRYKIVSADNSSLSVRGFAICNIHSSYKKLLSEQILFRWVDRLSTRQLISFLVFRTFQLPENRLFSTVYMTVCLDLYQTFLSISFETFWKRFPFDTFVSVGTYLLDFPFFKNFSLWELRISFLKNPFGIP